MRTITQLVIHHSASSSGTVEEFRREHKARGWSDIGYHRVIGNGRGFEDGAIHEGRKDSVKGSAVYGNNTGKLHVCLVGNFESTDSGYTGPPTASQLSALGHLLQVWELKYHPKGERGHIVVGHKEITIPGHGTACPGDRMPLDEIRQWFNYLIHGDPSRRVTLDVYLKGHGH